MGLRLRYEKQGERVWTKLHVHDRMVGWPNRLHSGLLYLAMTETANWTVYGALARIGLPVRTSALDAKRFVRVGETLTITGEFAASVARVEAHDERGALVAKLEREYILPTRAEFRARMGEDALPPEFEDLIPEN